MPDPGFGRQQRLTLAEGTDARSNQPLDGTLLQSSVYMSRILVKRKSSGLDDEFLKWH